MFKNFNAVLRFAIGEAKSGNTFRAPMHQCESPGVPSSKQTQKILTDIKSDCQNHLITPTLLAVACFCIV